MKKNQSSSSSISAASIRILKGLKSNSASRTDILVAENVHNPSRYIFKLFADGYVMDGKLQSVGDMYRHEIGIYKYLTETLIENPQLQVRNIVPLVGVIHFTFLDYYKKLCHDLGGSKEAILYKLTLNTLFLLRVLPKRTVLQRSMTLGSRQQKVSLSELRHLDMHSIHQSDGSYRPSSLDLTKTRFTAMVTPQFDGCTWTDIIASQKLEGITDFMDYLFLICITLQAMSDIGINQNDLHWGNILMDSRPPPLPRARGYLLYYDGFLLFVEKKYVPYVYDFDRAVRRSEKVPILQRYRRGGNCPIFHRHRDLLKLICCTYHALRVPMKSKTVAEAMLRYLVPSSLLRRVIRNTEPHCWMTTPDDLDSYLCNEKELESGILPWSAYIHWILSQTSYSKIDTTTVSWTFSGQRTLSQKLSVFPIRTRRVLNTFQQNIRQQLASTPSLTLERYLDHNFQYLGSPSSQKAHLQQFFVALCQYNKKK